MRITVVGGGIIGASCAAYLAERGAEVTVLDAGAPRFGTSLANAGHIVVSHSIPMAAPGMVGQGLRSLLARDGAFALSARPGRGTLGWLTGFARRCTASNVVRLQPGLDRLLHRSAELLAADPRIATTPRGLWQVFTSSKDRAVAEAEHLRHHGVRVRQVPLEELREEQALTEDVVAGIELTEDFGVDPAALWSRMRERSLEAGAQWHEAQVRDLRELADDIVVLASGVWSPAALRPLGVDLPVRAAKGYSVTLSGVETVPSRPMLLMDQRTAANALPGTDGLLRLSARYEITRANDRTIAQRRIDALVDRTRQVLRLPASVGELRSWTGVRPASIDGAPYIGFLPHALPTRVLVATGHGMIGTALAAGTADLVTRLAFEDPIDRTEAELGPARLFT